MKRSLYLGYNVHWSLDLLRHKLADTLAPMLIRESVLGQRRGGFYHDRNSPHRARLDRAIESTFSGLYSANRGKPIQRNPFIEVIDSAIDIEKWFFHMALASGVETILYHGDDSHTPDNFRFAKGRERLGDAFRCVSSESLDQCRSEVNAIFPMFATLERNDTLSREESIDAFRLHFALIDILASLRNDSRVVLFGTHDALSRLASRMPAEIIVDLINFFKLFEVFNGPILVPGSTYEPLGLQKNFFASKEFETYCRAHELLNAASTSTTTAVDALSSAVVSATDHYRKFVAKSTMNFAVAKAAERILGALSGDAFGYATDFVEVIARLCKERERKLVIYDGGNFEEFCITTAMETAFGSEPR